MPFYFNSLFLFPHCDLLIVWNMRFFNFSIFVFYISIVTLKAAIFQQFIIYFNKLIKFLKWLFIN